MRFGMDGQDDRHKEHGADGLRHAKRQRQDRVLRNGQPLAFGVFLASLALIMGILYGYFTKVQQAQRRSTVPSARRWAAYRERSIRVAESRRLSP